MFIREQAFFYQIYQNGINIFSYVLDAITVLLKIRLFPVIVAYLCVCNLDTQHFLISVGNLDT